MPFAPLTVPWHRHAPALLVVRQGAQGGMHIIDRDIKKIMQAMTKNGVAAPVQQALVEKLLPMKPAIVTN